MKKVVAIFCVIVSLFLLASCSDDTSSNRRHRKVKEDQSVSNGVTLNTASEVFDEGILPYGEWVLYENGFLHISGTGPMGYIANSDEVAWHEYRSGIQEVYIEEGVTSVSQFAFRDCTNLHTVTLPTTLTEISLEAFCRCTALEEINLPAGLTKIEFWAFAGCDSLQTLQIPGTIVHLDNYTFQDCKNLREITILPGVESVGFDVFDGCVALNAITIPNTVKSIDVCTFRYCTELEDVFYDGTEQEWNAIEIETGGNEPLFAAEIHYNA